MEEENNMEGIFKHEEEALKNGVLDSVCDSLNIIKDCVQYAKYKQWNSEVGDKKADEIMKSLHDGKYGKHDGFWIQVDRAVNNIKDNCH
jgi:hypothetical protein